MNKVFLISFMLFVSALYPADAEQLPMNKMCTLEELYHSGYLKKVIAYTTAFNFLRKGAFTLNENKTINYGIISCAKQAVMGDHPSYQIILRTFKKIDADGLECSFGHLHFYNERFVSLDDELGELFQKSRLAIRLATADEKLKLQEAVMFDRAKLEYNTSAHGMFSLQCMYARD